MSNDIRANLPFMPDQTSRLPFGSQVSEKAISDAVPRFQEALDQVQNLDETQGLRVAQVDATTTTNATDFVQNPLIPQTTPPVQATDQTADVDSRARAAEGFDLEPVAPVAPETAPGNSILSGLERLRSVFDERYASVQSEMQGVRMESTDMLALQAEVVKYSVLVDVSSKLAGKSTQAMDTLMKGQ